MYTETVTVGDNKYEMAQASAVKQRELLSLVGRYGFLAKATGGESLDFNRDMVMGLMVNIPEADLIRISDIVLYKTVEVGKDELVDIKSFQGQMLTYLQLLAEGVRVNLADFFGWLTTVDQKDAPQTPVKSQK